MAWTTVLEFLEALALKADPHPTTRTGLRNIGNIRLRLSFLPRFTNNDRFKEPLTDFTSSITAFTNRITTFIADLGTDFRDSTINNYAKHIAPKIARHAAARLGRKIITRSFCRDKRIPRISAAKNCNRRTDRKNPVLNRMRATEKVTLGMIFTRRVCRTRNTNAVTFRLTSRNANISIIAAKRPRALQRRTRISTIILLAISCDIRDTISIRRGTIITAPIKRNNINNRTDNRRIVRSSKLIRFLNMLNPLRRLFTNNENRIRMIALSFPNFNLDFNSDIDRGRRTVTPTLRKLKISIFIIFNRI